MARAANAPISSTPKAAARARLFLALFFSVFLAIGATMTYAMVGRPLQRIAAARSWEPIPCDITSSRVGVSSGDNSDTYRVDVTYRYAVEGKTYAGDRYAFSRMYTSGRSGKAQLVAQLPPGTRTTCFFDPVNPGESVVVRDATGELWFGLIPMIFFVVGAGGLYFAFISKRGRMVNLPGVPSAAIPASLTFAAATRTGPAELRPKQTRRAKFIAFVIAAVFWNAIVSVFLAKMLGSWRGGAFEWGLSIFLIPFVVVGVVLVIVAVWQGLQLASPRPVLTVDSDVVPLGDDLKVQWTIEGAAEKLVRLRIDLEGREEATYRRGTDTLTDRAVFASLSVLDEPAPVSTQGTRKVVVPAESMHSLDAPNNKIVWSLRVRGEIPNWPDSDDEFPVTVAPRRR